MTRLTRLSSILLAIGLVLTGCGEEEGTTIPFTAEDVEPVSIPDTLVSSPVEDLSDDEQRMVRVHSAWLCELQAKTFTDPSEIPAALEEHLASFEVVPAAYDEFAASLPGRKDLRDATLYAVQQTCFGR